MSGRVAVVTYGPTTHDSRVRRIVAALGASGREVHLVSPDAAPAMPGLSRHSRIPAISATRADVLRSIAAGLGGTMLPAAAVALHRLLPASRAAFWILRDAAPDAIHANDWCTLPAAIAAARATGGQVIYDSHENAVEEHAGLLWWRLAMRRSVAAIERRLIGEASHVVTIGDALADAIRLRHPTAIRGLTIVRNTPEASTAPLAERSGGPLRLAYAGLLTPERRIDAMLAALALLPDEWRLDITGFGPSRHVAALRALADRTGVAGRVAWHPPVPPERLVDHLAASDVGLFLSAGRTGQQSVALPNKVFEYTAAGMAVVAAGSAEAARLLARHGHGLALEEATPRALAAALRTLDRAGIEALRRRAAAARDELSWSREKLRLLAVYDALTPRRSPS